MQVLKGRLAREDIPEPIAREEELVALLHTADAYLWGGEGAVVSTCMQEELIALLHTADAYLWGGEGAVVSTCMLGEGGREAGRHLS